ncbi:MAG: Secretory immunoglobulin A-binding protein EsiB [Holosporales bacterium]
MKFFLTPIFAMLAFCLSTLVHAGPLDNLDINDIDLNFERKSDKKHQKQEKIKRKIEQLEQLAKEGDAKAMNELGVLYSKGDGVPIDEKKAFDYFKQAADAGLITAMENVALCYEMGKGVKQDLKIALKKFEELALHGHPNAYFYIAYMYLVGEGVEKDIEKAEKYMNIALDKKSEQAQHFMMRHPYIFVEK